MKVETVTTTKRTLTVLRSTIWNLIRKAHPEHHWPEYDKLDRKSSNFKRFSFEWTEEGEPTSFSETIYQTERVTRQRIVDGLRSRASRHGLACETAAQLALVEYSVHLEQIDSSRCSACGHSIHPRAEGLCEQCKVK